MTRATRDRIWDAVPLRAVANERPGGQPMGEGHPLDLGHLDPATEAQVVARLLSRDFDAWSEAASRVGHCTKPIRLHGYSDTVNAATGEVVSSFSSADSRSECCTSGAATVAPPSARPARGCTRRTRST